MIEHLSQEEARIMESDPKFELQKLLKKTLYRGGEILIAHHTFVKKETRKVPDGHRFTDEKFKEYILLEQLEGQELEWEGTTREADETRLAEMPRVRRIIFRNIEVDNDKYGSGNPAIRFDYESGKATLENGGIEREPKLIVESIATQVRKLDNHLLEKMKNAQKTKSINARQSSFLTRLKHFTIG